MKISTIIPGIISYFHSIKTVRSLSTLAVACGIGMAATAQPTITNVSPMAGHTPSAATITGTNFNTTPANNIVYFGATRAMVNSATATSLNVTVPVGATYKPVTVNNAATKLMGYSRHSFLPGFDTAGQTVGSLYFGDIDAIFTAVNSEAVVICDIDGDGKADVITSEQSDNTISVYRNTSVSGIVTFASKMSFLTAGGVMSIATEDIDGDGKPDVVTCGATSVAVLRNSSTSGTVNFAAMVTIPMTTSVFINCGKIRDIDGDGKADIVVGDAGTGNISILRNTSVPGSITMATPVAIAAGSAIQKLAIEDLNGDGKPDIAFVDNAGNWISVLSNTSLSGSILFSSKVDFPISDVATDVAIGDMDGDGKADIVALHNSGIDVLLNTSTGGVLGFAGTELISSLPGSMIELADMNGDGTVDILFPYFGVYVLGYLNYSTPGMLNFTFSFSSPTNTDLLTIGDIDGDGKADVVSARSNFFLVLRNTPPHPPVIVNGSSQILNVCHDSGPVSINSLLGVTDIDSAMTFSWNLNWIAPMHGDVVGCPENGDAGPGIILPTGITYQPDPGYVGTDSFAIVVIDATQGGDTTIIHVNINTAPSLITGNTSLCLSGLPVTLSNSSNGGTWSTGNSNIATVNSAGIVFPGSVSGPTTITYSNGCGPAAVTTITVTAAPAVITGNIATVCNSATITLSNATTGGVWTSANTGVATVNAATGAVTGVATGSTSISYFNACVSVTTSTITTRGPGTITGATDVCSGSGSITLSGGINSGTWSSSNPAIAAVNAATGVVTGTATGVATITYATGCGANAISNITVSAPLAAPTAITGTATLCAGATTRLSNATTGGVWSSSNTAVAAVLSGSFISGVSAGTATISYTLTNGCGTVAATRVVTVSPAPVAGAITGGGAPFCEGSTITLSNTTTGGSWSSSKAGIATVGGTGTVRGIAAGVVTISYSATNTCGTTSKTKNVDVLTAPAPGPITGPETVCQGQAITLANVVPGGVWGSDVASIAHISTGGVVTGLTAGATTIHYFVTNSCGTTIVSRGVVVMPSSSSACSGTVGVNNNAAIVAELKIFPNPNEGSFSVMLAAPGKEHATITITNTVGEKVKQIQTMTNTNEAMHLNVTPGIYFISVMTAGGERHSGKVVVQ